MKNVVVVLCYNDDKVALEYLTQIYKYASVDKIIVVDNASEEGIFNTLQMGIKKLNTEKIVLIRNTSNLGYAKGNNVGIRYAIENYDPKYITISNTDVEYDDATLCQVINFIDLHTEAGIVSPTMLTPTGKVKLPAWKLPTFMMAVWNTSFVRSKIFNPQKYSKLDGEYSEVDVLPGSLLIASAKVWTEVKGFDEDTFLYGEESLLSYKVKKVGKINYLLNTLFYMHRHSTIINKSIPSIEKKMNMLYEVNYVYNKKCLNTNLIQDFFYKLFFEIGKYELMLYYKIKRG